jgi:hypothetical protein
MTMKTFFKQGNNKIASSILTFTLPTSVCFGEGNQCKNCYAKLPESLFENVRIHRKRALEFTRSDSFVSDVITFIKRSGTKTVRMHESGDFYSHEYVTKWISIASNLPDITFYGMTKKVGVFNNLKTLGDLPNVNIINSVCKDGLYNYGDWERVNKLQQQDGYFLCPCSDLSFKGCGDVCKLCSVSTKICFLLHTPQIIKNHVSRERDTSKKTYYNFGKNK